MENKQIIQFLNEITPVINKRQTGKTHMLLYGVTSNPNAIYIVLNRSQKISLSRQISNKILTVSEVNSGHLRGMTGPISLDHLVISEIISSIFTLLDKLEREDKKSDEDELMTSLLQLVFTSSYTISDLEVKLVYDEDNK